MKIAIVTYALQVGGIEAVINCLADYTRRQGHQVSIFETWAVGRWSETFRGQGFDVQSVFANRFESRRRHVRRLATILRDFDAILLNDAPFAQAILGCLADRATAVPVLHSSLTSMVRNATANSNNWDTLVAVSPAVLESAVQFGAERGRVICIPNGIQVPKAWPKGSQSAEGRGPLKVAYLGTIGHQQKGVLHLPGILRKALDHGARVRMDVIGEGPDRIALKAKFAAQVEHGNVVLHGGLSNAEAKRILADSDVLLMPSYFEGLPIVLLEAMASGVVPIVSRLPGCTDFVVAHGQDGLLVEKGDEKGFADAIVELDRDRSIFRRLSEQAWRTAAGRFDSEQMGRAYLSLIEGNRARRLAGHAPIRLGQIDSRLLGDLPWLPIPLVRPVRKMLRMVGLFPRPPVEPLLVEPPQ